MYIQPVLELMSDSLTAIYIEPHQCPSHQSILLTQGPICEIFAKFFLRIVDFENLSFFESAILNFFFCIIHMKISPNLYDRMDGSKFSCFPWFPENSLLCVILRYTVYILLNTAGRRNCYSKFSFDNLCTVRAPLQPAVCILFTPFLKAQNGFLRSFFFVNF